MHKLIIALCLLLAPTAFAETAVFAGGCFWCVEAEYQDHKGVSNAVSGFTGGTHPNQTYSGPHTGHYEAVKVTYDPKVVSYQELLDIFWTNIDPFDDRGQFCDKGPSYRSAIFANNEQWASANASLAKVQSRFDQTVVTEILPAATFFPVEKYHQDYYKKNPIRYKFYRTGCGRDNRLHQIWGDDTAP